MIVQVQIGSLSGTSPLQTAELVAPTSATRRIRSLGEFYGLFLKKTSPLVLVQEVFPAFGRFTSLGYSIKTAVPHSRIVQILESPLFL